MRFEIDDEQIQASAKKELEIAVSGLIKAKAAKIMKALEKVDE